MTLDAFFRKARFYGDEPYLPALVVKRGVERRDNLCDRGGIATIGPRSVVLLSFVRHGDRIYRVLFNKLG
jgi:hypothetical protein